MLTSVSAEGIFNTYSCSHSNLLQGFLLLLDKIKLHIRMIILVRLHTSSDGTDWKSADLFQDTSFEKCVRLHYFNFASIAKLWPLKSGR